MKWHTICVHTLLFEKYRQRDLFKVEYSCIIKYLGLHIRLFLSALIKTYKTTKYLYIEFVWFTLVKLLLFCLMSYFCTYMYVLIIHVTCYH